MNKKITILLSIALLGSVGLNALLVARYRYDWRPWQKADEMPPLPEFDLANDALTPAPTLKLTFDGRSDELEPVAAWQDAARVKLAAGLGVDLPTAAPSARTLGTETVGAVTREQIVFGMADGVEVPAFLLKPTEGVIRGGLVVIPGHSWGIVATAGIFEDYQHSMALRLAEAGFAVLTFEVRGLGYLQRLGPEGMDLGIEAMTGMDIHRGQASGGVTARDGSACVSYLLERDDLDVGRVGVVGFSSGGKAAIYLAALDSRVATTVASGCVGSFEHNFRVSRHGANEAIPGLGHWLEMSDVLGLIAPRPLLVHWGANDTDRAMFAAAYNDSSMPTVDAARRIYAAAGAEGQLQTSVTPNMGHEFDVEAARRFLTAEFKVDDADD